MLSQASDLPPASETRGNLSYHRVSRVLFSLVAEVQPSSVSVVGGGDDWDSTGASSSSSSSSCCSSVTSVAAAAAFFLFFLRFFFLGLALSVGVTPPEQVSAGFSIVCSSEKSSSS